MNEFKKIGIFYFLLTLLPPSCVLAQSLPGDWKGYVFIDGSIAPDGTPVSATINNVEVASTTVGAVESGTGYYLIHVPGNTGDKVKFKICGVNVTLEEQSWSVGPHPNTTSGSPYINLSITTLTDGSTCTYACGCSGGYCVHGYCRSSSVYCGDGYCDSGETCSNCASDCGKCMERAGAAMVFQTINSASPTSPAVVSIPSDKAKSLKIDEVRIEVKEDVTNLQVTVRESFLPSFASLAITTDKGATYKYIEITTNLINEKIERVKIKFKVEKSWLTSNDIDESKVSLNRWFNGQWNKLTTTKIGEDSTYVYYEAESPGLSVFAITGEKKSAIVVKQPCPFECCIGEVNYNDKVCQFGYECKNRVCVAITLACNCTNWSNIGCGAQSCEENEMKQIRSCTPAACDSEERCVIDPSCRAAVSPSLVLAITTVVIIAIISVLLFTLKHRMNFRKE
ncbi:MAG: PGF-pre-PGF domain-containing protein [Candidatus Aenigmatarchaeota archaeon]